MHTLLLAVPSFSTNLLGRSFVTPPFRVLPLPVPPSPPSLSLSQPSPRGILTCLSFFRRALPCCALPRLSRSRLLLPPCVISHLTLPHRVHLHLFISLQLFHFTSQALNPYPFTCKFLQVFLLLPNLLLFHFFSPFTQTRGEIAPPSLPVYFLLHPLLPRLFDLSHLAFHRGQFFSDTSDPFLFHPLFLCSFHPCLFPLCDLLLHASHSYPLRLLFRSFPFPRGLKIRPTRLDPRIPRIVQHPTVAVLKRIIRLVELEVHPFQNVNYLY